MTNDKIKKAIKFGVKQEEPNPMEDLLEAANKEDLGGMVAAIMAITDEEFDQVEPGIRGALEKTFNSPAYQNTVVQKLNCMTDIDYEQQSEVYEGMKEMIGQLDMSQKKKDFLYYLFDNSYQSVLRYREDPSEHITVTFEKLTPDAVVPTYAHKGDAGADIYSVADVTIPSGSTMLVPTGIALKIPGGYEAQVRPRSGMSLKTKVRVANAPGTIDSNYRGEVGVIIDNHGKAPYIISKGDKIAQLVFNKVPTADFIEGKVETEEDNTRGESGFGSTGVNAISDNEQVSD